MRRTVLGVELELDDVTGVGLDDVGSEGQAISTDGNLDGRVPLLKYKPK